MQRIPSSAGKHDVYPDATVACPPRRFLDTRPRTLATPTECELRPSDTALVVALPRADATVRRAYCELVALARAHACRLFDPQHGADIDLDAPGELPPFLGGAVAVPEAPTRHAAVGVRLYVHHLGLAKQAYCDRFGATLVRETAEHVEVALCGMRFLPGEDAAECFVVRDCSDNHLEVRRAPEP